MKLVEARTAAPAVAAPEGGWPLAAAVAVVVLGPLAIALAVAAVAFALA
jgi:hypothetical protein